MFKKKSRWPWRARTHGYRSSKIPARKIPRSIARVRTDWVTIYNPTDSFDSTGCKYLVAPWNPINIAGLGQQCFSSFSLNVMFAQSLSDLYGDDVKIVKMVGDFWLKPVFAAADACFPDDVKDLQTAFANFFIHARGGLWKQRVVSSDRDLSGVVPHPLEGRDWSDAGFLKTWNRVWVTDGEELSATVYGEGQMVATIGAVTRAAYNTPATSSGDQPLFNVPEIRTDCYRCVLGGEECAEGPTVIRYKGPGWKRVSISSNRTIHMHEDDNLFWYVDWASLGPSSEQCGIPTDVAPPCAMHIVPHLKIKLQYG